MGRMMGQAANPYDPMMMIMQRAMMLQPPPQSPTQTGMAPIMPPMEDGGDLGLEDQCQESALPDTPGRKTTLIFSDDSDAERDWAEDREAIS